MTSQRALVPEYSREKIDVNFSIRCVLHHTTLATSVVMLRAPGVARIFRPPDLQSDMTDVTEIIPT